MAFKWFIVRPEATGCIRRCTLSLHEVCAENRAPSLLPKG